MHPPANPHLLELLIACSLKTTILLGCAWFATILARRQSAALRHLLWAAGILGALALPLLILFLPAWHPSVLSETSAFWNPAHAATKADTVPLSGTIVDAVVASQPMSGISAWALWVWALGFLTVVGRLAVGLTRLARLSLRSEFVVDEEWTRMLPEISRRLNVTRPVRLLASREQMTMPLTWGLLRPLILLPASARDWPEVRRRIVLSHEMAHASRGDWLLQMCGELARAVYWFHPLAWLAVRRLRLASECACDDSVLRLGVTPSDYANELLDLARSFSGASRPWYLAVAFARPSSLERRFGAMLNPLANRHPLPRGKQGVAFVSALCLLVPLACLRLPAQDRASSFTGTIHDPSGAPVSNATVVMSGLKADTFEMTVSNAEGSFGFKALPSGAYSMKVLKEGFEEYRVNQLVLERGRDASQNVTLLLGAITESVEVKAQRGNASSASKTDQPTRIRIGGEVQRAKLINKAQAVYPEGARAGGIEGTVLLHAVVGMNGSPLSLRVMNSEVNPDLARAAVEAVSKWQYSPALLNGKPVEVDTMITVNFKLVP